MVPQSDLKATQMDMGGPLETYGIYCVDATLGLLGRSRKSIFCSACCPGAYFLRFLMTFVDFGVKKVFKRGEYLLPDGLPNCTFFHKEPKSGHSGVPVSYTHLTLPTN